MRLPQFGVRVLLKADPPAHDLIFAPVAYALFAIRTVFRHLSSKIRVVNPRKGEVAHGLQPALFAVADGPVHLERNNEMQNFEIHIF